MNPKERLDLALEYSGALAFSIELKAKLIELDAPCRDALFTVIDNTLEQTYGETYEMERVIFETQQILSSK